MKTKKLAIAAAGMVAVTMLSKTKKNRSKWIQNWVKKKNIFGHMPLINELRLNEPDDFKNYLRMNSQTFNYLLGSNKYILIIIMYT